MSDFFVYECVFCQDIVVFFSALDSATTPTCNFCLDYNEALEWDNYYENNAYDMMNDR